MDKRIAVLGAGPMGLAVAYQLIKDGFQPVIFEADDRVGGMTASFDFDGLMIERFYHFHCTSDTAFLALLSELGIADKMRWVESTMGYYYKGAVHPWGNPLALLKFPHLSWVAKFRYGLHAFLSTQRSNYDDLDTQSAVSWIKRWVGNEAYRVLWQRLLEYKFYDYTPLISAAWVWARIRRVGKSRYNLMREKLGYLDGGSTTLLSSLETFIIEHGGEIHLSTPVQKIVMENAKIQGVQTSDRHVPFSKVISTIPLPYIPSLMPDLPDDILAAFKAVKNIAVVCVIAKLKKPVAPHFWLNVNDEEMDIPGVISYSNLRPIDPHIVYVPFYMPAHNPHWQDANDVFIEKVKRYLIRINPELTLDDFIAIHVSRQRYAQPICDVGYLEKLPPVALPVGGLWAADTSYYYPEDRGISESIAFGRALAKMATA